MTARRRRRNPPGFDPLPWIVGGVLAWAAYKLYQTVSNQPAS
jgi:hypothetical protein